MKRNEPSKKNAPYVFKQFNRKSAKHPKSRIIRILEHGWVKESTQRIKTYESVPKAIGVKRITDVLTRETADAIKAIENLRIDNL